jgi:hypothetical protein
VAATGLKTHPLVFAKGCAIIPQMGPPSPVDLALGVLVCHSVRGRTGSASIDIAELTRKLAVVFRRTNPRYMDPKSTAILARMFEGFVVRVDVSGEIVEYLAAKLWAILRVHRYAAGPTSEYCLGLYFRHPGSC